MKGKRVAVIYAVLAALLYALNTPVSKKLLSEVPVTLMASFLYLGAGIGVGIMYLFFRKNESESEHLEKKDFPYVLGMILLDIAAPIFMMLGIKLGTASNASLLGNFEIVATAIIALCIFKEVVSSKLWTAILLITLASTILSFDGASGFEFSIGSLFVILAASCWGLENNCTRKISNKSTYQIVILKGVFSGGFSFVLSLTLGEKIPSVKLVVCAMALGFVAYGLSIFTYVRAQRVLGAAKTGAYYALAPFIGVVLSTAVFGERPNVVFYPALALMIAGVAFAVWDTMPKKE